MKEFVNNIWWMVLLRGIALVLFGIAAVVWPAATFISLAGLFAVYVLVAGMVDSVNAVQSATQRKTWFVALFLGVVEIAVGIYLLMNPALSLATFITIVGFTFMFQGILALVVSLVDTKDAGVKLLEVIGGILSIVAGYIVMSSPITAGIALTWTLGVYGIIAGTLSISSALSLRHMSEEVEKVLPSHRAMA